MTAPSNPPPPDAQPPSRPPSGPTRPGGPTGPGRNSAEATINRIDQVLNDQLFVAVDVILLDIQAPARRDFDEARSQSPSAVATTGGPVPTLRRSVPSYGEGEHRLVGRVAPSG